jgi:hypothetical protein
MNHNSKPAPALNDRHPSGASRRTSPLRILAGLLPGLPVLVISLLLTLGGPLGCASMQALTAGDPYRDMSWDQIRPELSTPDRIVQYLRVCSITYKSETPGTLNHTPEETLNLRTGDCEDFAFLITDALIHDGYEARIISVEADRRTGLLIHAVAIYRDPNTRQWRYIHGYRFKGLTIGVSKGFNTEADVAENIASKMGGKLYQYFVMSPDQFKKTYDVMRN